jgi:hypothetical protein
MEISNNALCGPRQTLPAADTLQCLMLYLGILSCSSRYVLIAPTLRIPAFSSAVLNKPNPFNFYLESLSFANYESFYGFQWDPIQGIHTSFLRLRIRHISLPWCFSWLISSFQNGKILGLVESLCSNSHMLKSYLFHFIINTSLNINLALMTHVSSIVLSSVYSVFSCNQVFIIIFVQFSFLFLLVQSTY